MMTDDELLAAAKKWLRITNTAVDAEITQTAAACLLDLKNAGVVTIDTSDTLTQQAVKLYLKAHFGYDANAQRFSEAYEYLKKSMALSGLYNGSGT